MSDMRRGRLLRGAEAAHNALTLSTRVALCPPPPVARALSNPSWKVIVSASRGQYLKPGSHEPGFFSSTWLPGSDDAGLFMRPASARFPAVDRISVAHHHPPMITIPCTVTLSKKAPLPGASDRRAR